MKIVFSICFSVLQWFGFVTETVSPSVSCQWQLIWHHGGSGAGAHELLIQECLPCSCLHFCSSVNVSDLSFCNVVRVMWSWMMFCTETMKSNRCSDGIQRRTFDQIMDVDTILKYLNLTGAVLFCELLQFYSTAVWMQICYFLLHNIHLTASVSSSFAGLDD